MRKSIYAITAVLLLLAAMGCDTTTGSGTGPGAGQGQDGLVVVSLAIAGTTGGRSVLPAQAELTDVAKWRLLGGKTGETRKPLIELFSDPNNQTLLLATGDWDFILEGYADESGETLILRETIKGRRITLEGPNTLSFVVELVEEGTGSIEIAIELPAGHGINRVEVFKDGEKLELEPPLMPDAQNNIVFEQEDHEAGDYYYSFRLFKGDDLYGVVSELVQVRLNLSSKAAPKLGEEDLNLSYVIEYHLDSGKFKEDASVAYYYRRTDAAPDLPEPDRKGYEFDGWHTDDEFNEGPFAKLPTPVTGGNRDFYAQWTPKEYTITYKPDDQGIDYGENPEIYTIEDGDITLKKPPKRTGFRFGGWYRDAELEEPIIETPAISAGSTGDRTFYAEWIAQYTIVFETHGGSEVLPITEDMGTPVPWPENPTWGKSQFNGWFDETGDIEYKGAYTPTGDATMHAQWKHPVTFHPNGGSPVPEQYVVEDKKAAKPADPIKALDLVLHGIPDTAGLYTSQTLEGWHVDDPDGVKWNFDSDLVAGPLDLYAQWTAPTTGVSLVGQTGNNTIEKALNYIKNDASGATEYTIVLDENISMAGVPSSSPNITNANAVITLVGKTPTTISLSSEGNLFRVIAGKLVLDNNITLKGYSTNRASLIRVEYSGSLTMKDGATITGNSNTVDAGPGVFITFGGTFNMEGGTISGNMAPHASFGRGGGVYVSNPGTFNMSGGTISGNYANIDGGGVYVNSQSIFNMSGGTISGNYAEYGGGVYVKDGGSFSKTETSVIYGDTNTTYGDGDTNNNTATGGANNGHAVISGSKYRNKTLGSGEDISTSDPSTNWNQ